MNGIASISSRNALPSLQLYDPKLPYVLNKVFCNNANTTLNTPFRNQTDSVSRRFADKYIYNINPSLQTEPSLKNNKRELKVTMLVDGYETGNKEGEKNN